MVDMVGVAQLTAMLAADGSRAVMRGSSELAQVHPARAFAEGREVPQPIRELELTQA
jgi:hypothetical protein